MHRIIRQIAVSIQDVERAQGVAAQAAYLEVVRLVKAEARRRFDGGNSSSSVDVEEDALREFTARSGQLGKGVITAAQVSVVYE